MGSANGRPREEILRGMVEVEGGKISYETAGDGIPVLFLHAGIADSRMWYHEAEALGKDYQFVTLDMRGFGRSPPATGPYSILEDVSAAISQLQLNKPFLVGCSMGGALAIDFSLAYPEEISGLLLAAPGLSGVQYEAFGKDELPALEYDDKKSKEIYDAWQEGSVAKAEELLRQLWCSALTGKNLELFKMMVRENKEEVFNNRSMKHARDTPPAYGHLSGIKIPTVIMVGDRDNPSMVPFANLVARGIQGSRLIRVSGADHLINLSRPDAFETELISALARIKR